MIAPWESTPIHVNSMAMNLVHRVEKLPIKKRRKGYRVRTVMEPGMYQLGPMFGGVIVMHPEVYAKLFKAHLRAGLSAQPKAG